MSESTKEETKTFETTELSFAAYLRMKKLNVIGLKVKDAKENNNGRFNREKFTFVLEDKDNLAEKYKMDFLNSECHEFDSNVRVLKLMIASEKKKLNTH